MSTIAPTAYLTPRECHACDQLRPELREILYDQIRIQPFAGATRVRTLLALFQQSDPNQHAVITTFFLKLFRHPQQERLFQSLALLQQREQVKALFEHIQLHVIQDPATILRGLTTASQLPALPAPAPTGQFPCQKTIFTVLEKQRLLSCIRALSSSSAPSSDFDVQEFVDQMSVIHRNYGEELCDALSNTILARQIPIADVLWVIRQLSSLRHNDSSSKTVQDFVEQKIDWRHLMTNLQKCETITRWKSCNQTELSQIIQRFAEMPYALTPNMLSIIEQQYLRIQAFCSEYAHHSLETLSREARRWREEPSATQERRERFLALGLCAIFHHFQIVLHPTQVLTILGLLLSPQGCLAQVKTGEGKSMIVALLGLLFAVEGKGIHIISSSQNLSIRDQQKFVSFFKNFEITTSHICEHDPHVERFQATILYGTASDFEFAIMRELIYFRTLFRESQRSGSIKRFDCVIVDEVDNLTIDTILHGARIAFPAEISYDWIYAPILSFVRNRRTMSVVELREYLCRYEEGQFATPSLGVSDERLTMWSRAAFHALYELQEGRHYVIIPSEGQKKVCIIDADNTGRLMADSRWGGGVHEFVETKHSIPVARESLTPLSLSHPVYYDMYQMIFGLSGTLGARSEREEIRDIYNIGSFDVPPYRQSRRIDALPTIVPSQGILLEKILSIVMNDRAQGRPLLLLCETIADSITVSTRLTEHQVPHEVLNGIQKTPEEVVLQKAGRPGAITIATNTAGRGTDILLDEKGIRNGGLHVVLTFFPASLRVEQQARGRAGRQGQPGSSDMFVISSHSPEELLAKRELRSALDKEYHVIVARFCRDQFVLVQQFFSRYTAFRNVREQIIERFFHEWTPRRFLSTNRPVFERLPIKDQQIAIEAKALLRAPNNQEQLWRTLLDTVCTRIETLVIQNWARNFQEKVDSLIKESKIEQLLATKGMIEDIQPQIAEFIVTMAQHVAEQLLEQMRALFEGGDQSTLWNSYLDVTGTGVNRYLYQILNGTPPELL